MNIYQQTLSSLKSLNILWSYRSKCSLYNKEVHTGRKLMVLIREFTQPLPDTRFGYILYIVRGRNAPRKPEVINKHANQSLSGPDVLPYV